MREREGGVMVIIEKIDSVCKVQILDKYLSISISANTSEKGMNPSLPRNM